MSQRHGWCDTNHVRARVNRTSHRQGPGTVRTSANAVITPVTRHTANRCADQQVMSDNIRFCVTVTAKYNGNEEETDVLFFGKTDDGDEFALMCEAIESLAAEADDVVEITQAEYNRVLTEGEIVHSDESEESDT